MVLVDARPSLELAQRGPTVPGARVVRSPRAIGLDQFAAAVSLVLAESFSVERRRVAALEADAIGCGSRPECARVLVEVHGEPVAAVRRVTVDGGTYLSSIGTRPSWQGQGHAALVTATAVADALAAGSAFVHLAVEVENERATRLYFGKGGMRLDLRNGPELVFGSAADARGKWEAAARVLGDVSAAGATYLDLRVPTLVAAGGVGPIEPEPTPAPGTLPTNPQP